MKRHTFSILMFFLFSIHYHDLKADEVMREINLKDCKVLTGFYRVWQESLTRERHGIEKAAWIKVNGDDQFEFVKWDMTTEKQTISWHGVLPDRIVAAIHTHPKKADPKPSQADGAIAARLKIPVYTISRKGIWKVTPDGKVIQEAELQWFKEVKENPCEESDQKL